MFIHLRSSLLGVALTLLNSQISNATNTAPPLTFTEASAYYAKGDFVHARSGFEALANVGISAAHYNLGVMALKGQSLPQDNGMALGWFKAAQELGRAAPTDLLEKLEASASTAEQTAAATLIQQVGKQALTERLSARVTRCLASSAMSLSSKPDGTVPKLIYPKKIEGASADLFYPMMARLNGQQGILILSTVIDTDGRAKDVRVEKIVPYVDTFEFAAAAADYLRSVEYSPATLDGQPIAVRHTIRFRFGSSVAADFWNKSALIKLKQAADQGQPTAQLNVAYLSMLDDDAQKLMRLSRSEEIRLTVQSALMGMTDAQFWVSRWLARPGCKDADNTFQADTWLRYAAASGHPRAQLTLVQQLSNGNEFNSDADEIKRLLLKLSDSKDLYVQKRAALLLATHPLREVRDPAAALKIIEAQKPNKSSNPELDMVLAATYATMGNYDEALKAQTRAINKAQKLKWNLAVMQDMAHTYRSQQMPDFSNFYLNLADDALYMNACWY